MTPIDHINQQAVATYVREEANAILERIHGVLGNMLRTSEFDIAESVKASDIDVFLSDAAWAVCSTYHAVLKASQWIIFLDDPCLLSRLCYNYSTTL